MIDITNCNLRELVQAAYELSVPQGLGFMHFRPSPLTEEEISGILTRHEHDNICAVSMDYIHGRSVKLTVYKKEDRLWIDHEWYDHTTEDLNLLLKRIGVDIMEAVAC